MGSLTDQAWNRQLNQQLTGDEVLLHALPSDFTFTLKRHSAHRLNRDHAFMNSKLLGTKTYVPVQIHIPVTSSIRLVGIMLAVGRVRKVEMKGRP